MYVPIADLQCLGGKEMSLNVAMISTVLKYSHCVGQATQNCVDGFNVPIDIAINKEGLLYVLNRPLHGVDRVDFRTVVNIVSVQSEYIGQFGGYGTEAGKVIWPVSIAFDRNDRLLVFEEEVGHADGRFE